MTTKFQKGILYTVIIIAVIVLLAAIEYEIDLTQYNKCISDGGMQYSNSYAPLKCGINDRIYNNPKSVIYMLIYGTNQ